MTGVYSGTREHAVAWFTMLAPVLARGGVVQFVQLTCERDELFSRVEHEGRRALEKLVNIKPYSTIAVSPNLSSSSDS